MRKLIFIKDLLLNYRNSIMSTIIIIFFLISILSFAKEGVFYIEGTGIKAISLSLEVSSIDFGDVYKDINVDPVLVNFSVNAEANCEYQVEISNDDDSGTVQVSKTDSSYTTDTITYKATATGEDQLQKFYVDLDTRNISGDLDAIITVTVAYSEIS